MSKIYRLFLYLLIISGSTSVLSQNPVTVYPKEYPNALRNPLKGFRQDLDNADDPDYKYTTIVRDYIKWNDIENDASDGVQKLIDYANNNWSHLPELNVMVIPRVYLDWNSDLGNEYWPADLTDVDWKSEEFKERVINMIYKMGEAWDNDPRVAWVQTGIIGYWGEQENPVGIDEDGWAARMGAAFDEAFKNKQLLVRNQKNWDPYGYKWGVYWDSYAHPGQTSGSWTDIRNTTAQGRYLTEVIEGEVAYGWGEDKFDPIYGGEPEITLNNWKYTNNMLDVIKELHCTGLGWIASYFEINSGLNVNRDTIAANADKIQKAFGYRFVIPEFTFLSRADQGDTLDFSFKVKNTGSAPFYRQWPVAFTLIDEKTKQIIWTEEIPDVDITQWLPGSNFNYTTRNYSTAAPEYLINASVRIPDNIPAGQYMAGITILDPTTLQPGIFFAVENFLSESQSQPLSRIGIGEDIVGSIEVNPSIFGDPLEDDARFYSVSGTANMHITYPSDGAGFSPPASFPVIISTFNNSVTIDSVELYINGILENTLYFSPYIFNVSNLKVGTYSLEAKAYDNEDNIQTDEASVNIQIPGGLPWIEKFDLPDGTKSNAGESSWTAIRGGGIFEVKSGAFEVSDGKSYIGEFKTGVIDIASAPVTVSLNVQANSGGLDKGEDYIKLFKIIDGGPEILIGMVDGAESATLTESNITGKSIQLVIKGYTTFSGEVYKLDNLNINYDIPVATKDITIQTNGNGSVFPSAGIHSFYEGQTIVLTATPEFGYGFESWSGDFSGTSNPLEIIMDTDKTVTAIFTELPKYSLTTVATNGSISLSKPGGTYYAGTQLDLTANPDTGYKFLGWSGDLIGSANPVPLIIDGDMNVTANFIEIPKYTVTITATNGSITLVPEGGTYLEGTELTLLAEPESGFEFNGWTGDLSGTDNPVSFTVDGNKNIVADFKAIPTYTLTISATNGTVLPDPAGGSYPEGTVVSLTATADPGYEFISWSGDVTGISNPQTITMNGEKSITANFDLLIGIKENQFPMNTKLGQNQPNPFTNQTVIPYQLSNASHVKLSIYNMLGELVVTMINEYLDSGYYTFELSSSELSRYSTSGAIYFYRMETNSYIETRKLILGQ